MEQRLIAKTTRAYFNASFHSLLTTEQLQSAKSIVIYLEYMNDDQFTKLFRYIEEFRFQG
jgi:hypothetical protein